MEQGECLKAPPAPKEPAPSDEPAEVALRAQVLTPHQHKAIKLASVAMLLFSMCAFAYALAFKATAVSVLFRKGNVQAVNIIFAGLNCATLGGLLCVFSYHLVLVHRARLQWPRRKRVLVHVALAMLVVQFVNSVFFLSPNATSLAISCSWFRQGVFTAAFVRWSCWNSLFCLFTIHAHNIVPLKQGSGQLRRQVIEGKVQPVLTMDASSLRHLPQLVIWVCMEFCIVFLAANNKDDFNFHVSVKPGTEGLPCQDRTYICHTGIQYRVLTSLWIAALIVYLLAFIRATQRRLLLAPYKDLVHVHLMVMQQKRQMKFVMFLGLFSTPILWFTKWDRCNNYFVAWLGLLPLQMIASTTVFVHSFYYMPMRPGDRSVRHVWLQEFAWLEADLDASVQRRARHSEAQRARLLAEPMFCFESAIKLLLWSELVYYDYEDEAAAAEEGEEKGELQPVDDSPKGSLAFCSCLGYCSGSRDEEGVEAADSGGVPAVALKEAGPASAKSLPGSRGSSKRSMKSSSKASLPAEPPKDVNALLRTAMAMYGLQHYELIYEPLLETRVLLAWSGACLVVAFRGTAGKVNALSDVKWWLGRQPLVHKGFLETWQVNGLHDRVVARIEEIVAAGSVPRDDFRVYLTGHSLGGALATLAAADLQRERRLPRLAVYTYGAPRTGNDAFAAEYGMLARQTWHVINDRDAVPRSGKFVFLYKRPGQRTLINQMGDIRVRPTTLEVSIHSTGFSIKQHFMASYLQSLWAICASQRMPARALPGGPAALDSLAADPQMRAYFATLGLDLQELASEAGEAVPLQSLRAGRAELHSCWGLWAWLARCVREAAATALDALPVDEAAWARLALWRRWRAVESGSGAAAAREENQPGHLATRLSAIRSGLPPAPSAPGARRSAEAAAKATPAAAAAAAIEAV